MASIDVCRIPFADIERIDAWEVPWSISESVELNESFLSIFEVVDRFMEENKVLLRLLGQP